MPKRSFGRWRARNRGRERRASGGPALGRLEAYFQAASQPRSIRAPVAALAATARAFAAAAATASNPVDISSQVPGSRHLTARTPRRCNLRACSAGSADPDARESMSGATIRLRPWRTHMAGWRTGSSLARLAAALRRARAEPRRSRAGHARSRPSATSRRAPMSGARRIAGSTSYDAAAADLHDRRLGHQHVGRARRVPVRVAQVARAISSFAPTPGSSARAPIRTGSSDGSCAAVSTRTPPTRMRRFTATGWPPCSSGPARAAPRSSCPQPSGAPM